MYALFNRFELSMTLAQAQSASRSGVDAAEDVAALLKIPAIRRQVSRIPDAALVAELDEYGAWDETELGDRAANETRIVWIAAGDISDVHPNRKARYPIF